MLNRNKTICPKCGSDLKYYDKVKRIVRTKGRVSKRIEIRRFKCVKCKSVHRELPGYIIPYTQYEAEIIKGVLEGYITSDMLGFEDYPCEMTMVRWRMQKLQLFLW